MPATTQKTAVAAVLIALADSGSRPAVACAAALDEVESIITSAPIVVKAAGPVEPRVDVPELVLAGEPVPVHVALDDAPRLAVKIAVYDETGALVESRAPKPSAGISTAAFAGLPPGAYRIDVTGHRPGSPVAPVSSDILVWSEAEANAHSR